MGKERNEDGQYVNTIELDSILDAVREGGHVVTTEDVADSVDISREAARQKLVTLEERDRIEKEGGGVVWWMESPWPTSRPEGETTPARKRRQQKAGKQAVPAVVEHLRENGPTREDELKQIAWQSGGDVYIEDKDTLWDATKPNLVAHTDVDVGGMGPWKLAEGESGPKTRLGGE